MHKSGWWIGALMLPLAACSNSDSAAETPAGKSGLSSTLVLSAASDAEKLQFCNWLVSVAPSDACGAPSVSSADGGAPVVPVALDGGATSAVAYCLATFSGLTNGCSVVAAEQCFSTWEVSGACKVPVAGACAAYSACSKATPPKNDGPPTKMMCGGYDWNGGKHNFGELDHADWTEWRDWLTVPHWDPTDKAAADALCKSTFPACPEWCMGFDGR